MQDFTRHRFGVALWSSSGSGWPEWFNDVEAESSWDAVVLLMRCNGLVRMYKAAVNLPWIGQKGMDEGFDRWYHIQLEEGQA